MKRITIGLVCLAVLTALALSGCAGGGNGGDDRIGVFGTGYGSNGARLFERDPGSGSKHRVKEPDQGRAVERGRLFGSEDEGNGSRDGGGAGRFDDGVFTGRLKDSDKLDDTRSFRVGNGYDGINPDGAGSSDPGPVRGLEAGTGTVLRLGGVTITEGGADTAAQAGEAGEGGRVLRVTSPAARKALKRLSRSLSSGRLPADADRVASDLRIVLKDAR